MTQLEWSKTGERFFQTGVDHGVLYPNGKPGVAWNGLTGIDEEVSGGAVEPYYFDGVKYFDDVANEDFQATLKAYMYPNEFEVVQGQITTAAGLYMGRQQRQTFGLAWRTKLGNDIDGVDHGYRLHLLYNATAAPSGKSYQTLGTSPTLVDFSWSITAVPVLPGTPSPGSAPGPHPVSPVSWWPDGDSSWSVGTPGVLPGMPPALLEGTGTWMTNAEGEWWYSDENGGFYYTDGNGEWWWTDGYDAWLWSDTGEEWWNSDPSDWVWPEGVGAPGWPMGPDGNTPVKGWKPTPYIWVDSNKVDPLILDSLEGRLFGSTKNPAYLPSQFDVMNILNGHDVALNMPFAFKIPEIENPEGPIPGGGPGDFATLSFPDSSGDHYGGDHDLIQWSPTQVAAIFTSNVDRGDGEEATMNEEGYVQMLTINPTSGAISQGDVFMFTDNLSDANSGWGSATAKVGNLLVHWRAKTETLFTLSYNPATGDWDNACNPILDPFNYFANDPVYGRGGVKLVPWADDGILLIVDHDDSAPGMRTDAMFGHWTGTGWVFGAISDVFTQFGGGGSIYSSIAPILGEDENPKAITHSYYNLSHYIVISGSYPDPPVATWSTTSSGITGYLSREFFAIPNDNLVVRVIPLVSGTLQPKVGGDSTFDWGIMPLILEGGEVVEGAITSLGPADDYYDIAVGGTASDHLAAVWALPGAPAITMLGYWKSGGVQQTLDLSAVDPTYGRHGIKLGDLSWRPIAVVGEWVVTGWVTKGVLAFQVRTLNEASL